MLIAGKLSALLLLFIFAYFGLYHLFMLIGSIGGKRKRLFIYRRSNEENERNHLPKNTVLRYVAELLEAIGWNMQSTFFITLSFVLMLSGVLCGFLLFKQEKAMAALGCIFGALPLFIAKMKLISVQMKTRLEFLPAVEIFYESYLAIPTKNIRAVLKHIVESSRLSEPMLSIFEQLYRNLAMNRDPEEVMRIFTLTLGHSWAKYYATLFLIGLQEGVDISVSLYELVTDMRRARLADQEERNRLLEIRVANFSPLLFLAVFLAVNFRLHPEQAYYYYLVQPAGRSLLLDAIIIIFASMVMGVLLSFRRM